MARLYHLMPMPKSRMRLWRTDEDVGEARWHWNAGQRDRKLLDRQRELPFPAT